MRLNSFTVEGYKNLTTSVTFGPLGAVNALHGPNNSGKTNLLGAIDLFFGLLKVGNHVSKDQFVSMDAGEAVPGHPFSAIFTVGNPTPIRLQAELSLPAEELRASSVEPEGQTDPTTITLELTPVASGAQLRVTQFQLGKVDVSIDSSGPVRFAEALKAFIAGTFFVQTEESVRPFALVDPYEAGPEPAAVPGLVTQRLRDALFDARQSLDRERRARWTLFVQLMRELEPELGLGEFDTAFDRSTGRANLVFDAGTTTMSIDRLGAGVQRMAALVASLVLVRAQVVACGEPELGLTSSLQQRLQRALGTFLAAPGGPSQLLFTTHSPILGAAETAFALDWRDGVPVLEPRACEGSLNLPPGPLPEREGERRAPKGEDLDALIGLVDQLAELEPEALVAAAPGAQRPAPSAQPSSREPGAGSREPAAGTPSWKYQNKR